MATVEEGTVTQWFDYSMFSLMFNEEVRVKKTSVDKFSFMDSLNFFGSNLGLWPGLGLYQILEWMVGIFLVSQILKKIRSMLCRAVRSLMPAMPQMHVHLISETLAARMLRPSGDQLTPLGSVSLGLALPLTTPRRGPSPAS